MRVSGYPINGTLLDDNAAGIFPLIPPLREPGELTVGYIGRLHEEKGLRLLAAAVAIVRQDTGLPRVAAASLRAGGNRGRRLGPGIPKSVEGRSGRLAGRGTPASARAPIR